MGQSIKSARDIEKLQRENKVLSKRLVEVEKRTAWLFQQLKTGMSAVLTDACHNIAKQELSAEIKYEPTVDEKLEDVMQRAVS